MAIEMIRDPREKIMERAAEIRRNVEAAQNGTPPRRTIRCSAR